MIGTLSRSVAPTFEPVTIERLRSNLRLSSTADDVELYRLLLQARELVEQRRRLVIPQATWQWKLPEFPAELELLIPLVPVTSISTISYVDTAGVTQTWSSTLYQLDPGNEMRRARLAPAHLADWPSTRSETLLAVTITFVAGWSSAAAVPEPLKRAILLVASGLYEQRGDGERFDPAVADGLLDSYGVEGY